MRGDLPLLDVRAPMEFSCGAIPGAMNGAILNDEERAEVGTAYKQEGPDAAIALGHRLVSGSIRHERIAGWATFFRENPKGALYCFRGGQRSTIAQNWLREAGIPVSRIAGGYKAVRRALLEAIERRLLEAQIQVVAGRTGSGKTDLLNEISSQAATLNLEALANHRGSAFGAGLDSQPSQADFENRISLDLMRIDSPGFYVEDESRLIGRLIIPEKLFGMIRQAPLVAIDEKLEDRAIRIHRDYVCEDFGKWATRIGETQAWRVLHERIRENTLRIRERLGGLKTQEILREVDGAFLSYSPQLSFSRHQGWISRLLCDYYDKLYEKHMDAQKDRIIFRGSYAEALQYLKEPAQVDTRKRETHWRKSDLVVRADGQTEVGLPVYTGSKVSHAGIGADSRENAELSVSSKSNGYV